MVRNPRHVATGVEAVCESATAITREIGNDIDLWVAQDEMNQAVETVKELTGQKRVEARLYGDGEDGLDVCIEL